MKDILVCFNLPEEIFVQESLEDRQVPDVDNTQSYSAGNQEGQWQHTKVEKTLIIHPSNDENPDEECEDVQLCIPGEL